MNLTRLTLCVTAALAVSGCSSMINASQEVDALEVRNNSRIAAGMSALADDTASKLPYVTEIKGPYLGVAKQRAKNDQALPPIFHEPAVLAFPGKRITLSTMAERLTKVIGIPVVPKPDIFLPASAFMPKSSGGAPAPAAPALGTMTAIPTEINASVSAMTSSDYATDVELNYTGTYKGLLDFLCARLGINWEYRNGQVVLYRLVTKTLPLKSPPGSSELRATVGKVGTTSGNGSSFASDSSVKMGSSISIWDSVKESVSTVLTGVGKVSVSEATGTITVIDTKESVEQVEAMVNELNRSLSRQVAFRVEVLSVVTNKDSEYGVNWNTVFQKVANGAPSYKWMLSSPPSLTGVNASNLSYRVLTSPTETNTRGALSGSEAMFAALATQGKVSVVTTTSALTLNRQPAPVAITEQTPYVSSVTLQPATSTSAATMSVTPATVTTGFILNLLPAIHDSNSLMLQFNVDVSTLKKLGTFGEGATAVQQPEVSSMQFLQRVGLKNGETLVLAGFERSSGQYDRRTLTEDADLIYGGSQVGSRKREAIVIMITPVISEGI